MTKYKLKKTSKIKEYKRPVPQTTVTCSLEVRNFIRIISKFMGTSQSNVVKSLLLDKCLIPNDDTYNIFCNWNSDTDFKYQKFVKDQMAKDYISDKFGDEG